MYVAFAVLWPYDDGVKYVHLKWKILILTHSDNILNFIVHIIIYCLATEKKKERRIRYQIEKF